MHRQEAEAVRHCVRHTYPQLLTYERGVGGLACSPLQRSLPMASTAILVAKFLPWFFLCRHNRYYKTHILMTLCTCTHSPPTWTKIQVCCGLGLPLPSAANTPRPPG